MRSRPLLFIVPLILFSLLPAPCRAEDPPPTKPRKILIEDGEFLKYGNYIGGERYQDVNIVSWYSADRKTIKVYVGKHFIGTNVPMPTKYTDYRGNSSFPSRPPR